MNELRKIGEKIARNRRENDLTQEDLAGIAEIDRSYLSEIERGQKNLSVLALLKIAKALRIKPSALLD
jgi:transcriptional regulator with XRE-family HTH domain